MPDWSRDDAPRDPRFLAEWQEAALPHLGARLYAGRHSTTGRRKLWVPPGVEIVTGPGTLKPTTGDPDRIRAMAAMLLDAADALDQALVPGLHQLGAGSGNTVSLF